MTVGEPGCDSDTAAVAAAMVRHVLPAAPSLRLEITSDDCGIWLHLTYPAPTAETAPNPPAHELALIDSAARTWGHFGDSRWHTLWAVLPLPADTAKAGIS